MKEKIHRIISSIFPTFGNILWMAAFYGFLFRGQYMINADGDLALHLNLGKYILDTGHIPLQDIFSHTMSGQPVVQHEWLTTVIFEASNQVFGMSGIIFLCALVISTTIYIIFRHLSGHSHSLFPVLVVVLLILTNSLFHWLVRPHIFSFLFLTIWMIELDQLRQGKLDHWWVLPLLMLFWVNMHGGFIIGFITWIISGVGIFWDTYIHKTDKKIILVPHFWKSYLLAGGLSFLASLINPSGLTLWIKVISHAGNRYLADITREFQSPNFHYGTSWPFLIYIVLLVLGLGFLNRRVRSDHLFNLSIWLALALYSVRNIPLFAIIASPVLVMVLDDLFRNINKNNAILNRLRQMDRRLGIFDKQLKGYFWIGLSTLIVIIGFFMDTQFDINNLSYRFDPQVFPVEAVEWLKNNPQEGEMFNYFNWGGYLQYHLWPDKKVFIDSKSDFYGEEFVRNYLKVLNHQEGWKNILEKYDVDWAILPPDEPAVKALQHEFGWKIIFKNPTSIILQKP